MFKKQIYCLFVLAITMSVEFGLVQKYLHYISFSRKIYLKSQADWDGIVNDLCELDWPHIYILYRQVDFVASMNDAFEGILVR